MENLNRLVVTFRIYGPFFHEKAFASVKVFVPIHAGYQASYVLGKQ